MKILFIHSAYRPGDLIGSWFSAVQKKCRETGGDAWFAIKYTHRDTQDEDIIIGDSFSCGIHNLVYQYTGIQDMLSYRSTQKFLKEIDIIQPDIIHCHVVNDMFLHMGLFCDYVNRHNIKVVWTFHDARVMTGQCPCPMSMGCLQWQSQCHHCSQENRFLYPTKEWVNLVSWVHAYRKKKIGSITNLTIATPSKWMASLVFKSYLKEKRVLVINNGIDLTVFCPQVNNIREKYSIPMGSKVLLSVGNPLWELKGRKFLRQLSKELPADYYFVMVGCLPEDIDTYAKEPNVLALSRIERGDLIGFYSAADLFVNPTLADNFPTVNLEAQACGCPVVAFDSDGTSETVAPKGVIVPRCNYEALKKAIVNFEYEGAREDALVFASNYSQEKCIAEYMNLYESL